MENRLRILIADDHPLYREGLRRMIELKSECEIVSEAGDGESALESIRQLRPDIAILDIGMPRMDGLAVARALLDESIPVGIIFLTMYREEKLFNRALEVGALGYVLKESAAADIISCIKAVTAGEHYTSPALTSYLIKRKRAPASRPHAQTGVDALTPTERRVLSMLAECKTSQQISDELFISRRTVDHHRANISQKLDIHGSNALMKFALDNKELLTT